MGKDALSMENSFTFGLKLAFGFMLYNAIFWSELMPNNMETWRSVCLVCLDIDAYLPIQICFTWFRFLIQIQIHLSIFQLKRKKLSLANAVNYTGQGSVSDGFNTSLKNQLKNHLFLESDYIARAVCFWFTKKYWLIRITSYTVYFWFIDLIH